jgi:predicted Rossmann-fold nucleotide-binding protein
VDYWQGLLDWIADRPLAEAKISPDDLKLLQVTDDVDEAVTAASEYWLSMREEPPVHEPEKADAQ